MYKLIKKIFSRRLLPGSTKLHRPLLKITRKKQYYTTKKNRLQYKGKNDNDITYKHMHINCICFNFNVIIYLERKVKVVYNIILELYREKMREGNKHEDRIRP